MKRVLLPILLVLIVGAVSADQIANFRAPGVLRTEITIPAFSEWILADPAAATGCANNDCCPNTAIDDTCTGVGAPLACCAATPAASTCNHEACSSFQVALANDPDRWLPLIEVQYQNETTAFACDSWLDGSRWSTACTTVPATPLIRFADIASRVAAKHFVPAQ